MGVMATQLPCVLEVTPVSSEVDLLADTDPVTVEDLLGPRGEGEEQEVPANVGYVPEIGMDLNGAQGVAFQHPYVEEPHPQEAEQLEQAEQARPGGLQAEMSQMRQLMGQLAQQQIDLQQLLTRAANAERVMREQGERGLMDQVNTAIALNNSRAESSPVLPPITTQKYYQKPMLWDGKTVEWEDYKAHFLMCANANGWSDAQKALFLGCNLRESPQRFAAGLTAAERGSWDSLCARFDSQFGLEKMQSIYAQELVTRVQRKSESLRELSIEMKRLGELAHPGPESPLRDSIILTNFLRAIGDDRVRSMACQLCPKDLTGALDTAMHITNTLELESNRAEVVKVYRKSGQVRAGEETQGAVQQGLPDMNAFAESMKSLQESIEDLKKNSTGGKARGPRKPKSELECYECHGKGHFARECPNRSDKTKQGNDHSVAPEVGDAAPRNQ